jgi:hypothetical protein
MGLAFHVVGEPEAVKAAIAKHSVGVTDTSLWEALNYTLQRLCELAHESPGLEVEVDGYLDGINKEWLQLRINVKTVPLVMVKRER